MPIQKDDKRITVMEDGEVWSAFIFYGGQRLIAKSDTESGARAGVAHLTGQFDETLNAHGNDIPTSD
ncbi:MAG: hypothetical protein ACPG6L_09925 [Nereida ignava]